MCVRATAGDVDAISHLSRYAPASLLGQPGRGSYGPDAGTACDTLARQYERYWTALMEDADADAAVRAIGGPWPPSFADAYDAYAYVAPPGMSRRAGAGVDMAEVVEAIGRQVRRNPTVIGAQGSVGPHLGAWGALLRRNQWPATTCDPQRVYYIIVGYGDAEADTIFFGLDRSGTIDYVFENRIMGYGDEPPAIGAASPMGQAPGRVGRRPLPEALQPYEAVLPALLDAAIAESEEEGTWRYQNQQRPFDEPAWNVRGEEDAFSEDEEEDDGGGQGRTYESVVQDGAREDEPWPERAGLTQSTAAMDIEGEDEDEEDGEDEGEEDAVPMGAAEIKRALAPLKNTRDLPAEINTYLYENIADADYWWFGGRPVSAAFLDECELVAALRLFVIDAGRKAARAASSAFARPRNLAAAAARAYAASGAPLTPGIAPPEILSLAGAYTWYDACTAPPLADGSIRNPDRLLEAARTLEIEPNSAERVSPELLCHALAEPAVSRVLQA